MKYNIKDGDLIITPNYVKKELLKEISKQKKIINCKFIDKNTLKKILFETYDEIGIYRVMKEFKLKCEVAKEYLNNIHINYKEINKIRKYLNEEKLLIKSKNNLHNYKRVIIYGYKDIEPYILDKLNIKVIHINPSEEIFTHTAHEFKSQTDEIVYVAEKIAEKLKDVNPEKIKLVLPSSEYKVEVKRIFKMFNIPLNIDDNIKIYSSKTVKDFIDNLKRTKDIKKSLETLPKNDIYNEIVDQVNKLYKIKKVDDIYIEILENKLKGISIKKEYIDGAIDVISFEDIHSKSNYYYILGFNQNVIPKLFNDNELVPDKIKRQLGMFTSVEKNKLEKEKVKNIITTYPNIYISYKLEDKFSSYYPSSMIKDLNIEVIENDNPKLKYSNEYNRILLSELLDDYINYGEKDRRLYSLYSTYKDINYRTYNNQFKNINSKTLNTYLKYPLNLSYTSINNYFLCPFKFYIENILKLNKITDDFNIIIGSLVHYVLENMYEKDFDIDTYFKTYLKDIELSPRNTFFINKIKDIIKEDIEVIKQQDNNSKFREKITEKKITIDKGNDVHFTGIIDKISKLNDYIIITDYKTGSNISNLEGIDEGLNLQLPTYIYLIKRGLNKDYKIAGFYLQKLIHLKPLDKDEDTLNNLKLNGYTINDEDIIKKIDKTYENSKVIKGMKKTKSEFYRYTKLIEESEIEKIENIVDKNIDKVIKAIKDGKFQIEPKKVDRENISCKYCRYKDLCYVKEDNIKYLKLKSLKEIVGDENASMD